MGNTVRSMQGRPVDMEKLMGQNELMPAIGNVRVNARGDELGPGGTIIRKREEVIAEYYENNPNVSPEKKIEPVTTKIEENVSVKSVQETTMSRKGKTVNES